MNRSCNHRVIYGAGTTRFLEDVQMSFKACPRPVELPTNA